MGDSSPVGRVQALLVGIDTYLNPEVPPLTGCVNDVHAMEQLLVSGMGVPAENVLVLTNGEATRAAILDGFERHLLARGRTWAADGSVAPPPAFLFYFSGHGSQLRLVSGKRSEPDGRQETICPCDVSRDLDDVRDIRDSELGALLSRLPGGDVTVVLDCCHSGSGTRFGRVSAPRQQTRFLEPGVVTSGGAPPPGRAKLPPGEVLLAACRPEQESHETADAEGRPHGAFSLVLLEELARAVAVGGMTYRDLMDRVQLRVNARFRAQFPIWEGAGDRVVLATDHVPRPPSVRVIGAVEDHLVFDGGSLHGITGGTRLAVVAGGAEALTGAAVAVVEIDDVEAVRCRGRVVWGQERPPNASLARVERAGSGDPPLALGLAIRDDAVRTRLQAPDLAPLVRIVDDPGALLRLEPRPDGPGVVLTDGVGEPLLWTPQDPDQVAAALDHAVRWWRLANLAAPPPDLLLPRGVQVSALHLPAGAPADGEPTAAPRDESGRVLLRDGDRLVLDLANETDEPVYVAVLELAAGCAVTLVHPAVQGSADALHPGEHLRSGGAPDAVLNARVPAGQPETESVLLVVTTTRPTSFDGLALAPFDPGHVGRIRPGGPADSPDPLERLMPPPMGAGRRAVGRVPGRWTAQRLGLVVTGAEEP